LKPILYTSPYVPAEWIAAHGFEPTRFVPRRNAGGTGPVLPREGVCPFMRLFVNEAARREAAGVVLATTCDQMRRARDPLQRQTTKPCFLLNVPSVWQTPSAHAFYRTELERLGRFLESLGGTAPSLTALVETMDRYDRRRSAPPPANRFQAAPSSGRQKPGIPIALVGGPLTGDDVMLYRLVAEAGGVVVLDGTEEGERAQPARFDRRRLHDDPLGELVAAYFGAIPDVFRRPNSALFAWLRQELPARGVRGVILARQVWCDKWHAEVQRLRDWLAVPLLDVDLDGEPCAVRMRTRVEAFMEALA
jgi:benzoyl-CoA reductase/2-hydroxyglutaryl-CoA dehydratase subunit BcrC/BadD/HgdB